jgi:hypothetical protein
MTNPIIEALKETTILACVSTRALGLERTDKAASQRAVTENSAVAKAARVQVNRLAGADDLHKTIVSIQNMAAQVLKANSQPFGEEDKWRLLPNVRFEKFLQQMHPIKLDYDKAIDRLRNEAPAIIDAARANVGTFDVSLPSVEEMIGAYEMRTDFRPVPDSSNFRGLNENTINKLRERTDNQIANAVSIAQTDTLKRFVDPLERFIERMQAYDTREPGKKAGIFRDTVVTNIKELHEVLDSFNITGDERLTQLGNLLGSLVNTTPQELRDLPVIRQSATSRAQEVLSNLNDWLK